VRWDRRSTYVGTQPSSGPLKFLAGQRTHILNQPARPSSGNVRFTTPGAPKSLRCLCGSLERCVSILCLIATVVSMSDRLPPPAAARIAEAAAFSSGNSPVPSDEPTSNTLEEFSNRFLTIFWLCQHELQTLSKASMTQAQGSSGPDGQLAADNPSAPRTVRRHDTKHHFPRMFMSVPSKKGTPKTSLPNGGYETPATFIDRF